MEDLMPFDLPKEKSSIIKVVGVGGGGSNAVNHMYKEGITDVDFIVCNTDQQSLINSPVPIKIHLGQTLTGGLGAGNKPEKGREAAIENLEDVQNILKYNTKMAFITAGMGGGTGTGAAPVIAKAAKELDPALRAEQYLQIQRIFNERGAIIVPFFVNNLWATAPNLKGVVPTMGLGTSLDLRQVYFEK